MSTSLQRVIGLPSGNDLLALTQTFKEIGALVSAGFFPESIRTVQQAMAVCWMAHAVGAHPMVALQNCYVVHGRVGFDWRFKWGLVKSRYPEAELEVVEQDDNKCVVRARTSPNRNWSTVKYTMAQCMKNPVTSKNPLYVSAWPDMSKKACVTRLMSEIAPEALLGLPSGEVEEEALPAAPEKGASSATVLDKVAAAPVPETTAAAPAPAEEEVVVDWNAALATEIKRVWFPSQRMGAAMAREKASLVLTEIKGIKFVVSDSLAPSDAKEAVDYLRQRYPEKGAAENATGLGSPESDGGGEAAPTVAPKSFDEQHAELGGVDDQDAVPLEGDVAIASGEAALIEADGSTDTLFLLSGAAKKTHPTRTFIKEAPDGSGKWFFVDPAISKSRGYTTGLKVYDANNGGQCIDAAECRALVGLMREAGVSLGGGR